MSTLSHNEHRRPFNCTSDTALRRRFSFVEMQPDVTVLNDILVDGIDIAAMLDTLNKRITVLLDREHTIGHSYLLPLKANPTLEMLADIFKSKIIPLYRNTSTMITKRFSLYWVTTRSRTTAPDLSEKANTVKLFGNADIDFPEYYEVNSAAFEEVDAYAFL